MKCPVTPAATTVDPDVSFCSGNYTLTYSHATGRLKKVENQKGVEDGIYDRVRIVGGCIVEAFIQDRQPIAQLADPCCNSSSGNMASQVLDRDCNLLEEIGGQLMARFTYLDEDPRLDITGCGSLDDPFRIRVNMDVVKDELLGNGFTGENCNGKWECGVMTENYGPTLRGFRNLSPNVLAISVDDECVLNIGVVAGTIGGSIGSEDYIEQRGLFCPGYPQSPAIFVRIYENRITDDESNFSVVSVVNPDFEGGPGATVTVVPPGPFDTLEEAQAFAANVQVTRCPATDSGNQGEG